MLNIKEIATTLAILGTGAIALSGCKKDTQTTEQPAGAGGDATAPAAEGSCGGEKKEGEGSCGGEKKEGEGSCGGEKKEGEGACGGEKKEGEGSCGAKP